MSRTPSPAKSASDSPTASDSPSVTVTDSRSRSLRRTIHATESAIPQTIPESATVGATPLVTKTGVPSRSPRSTPLVPATEKCSRTNTRAATAVPQRTSDPSVVTSNPTTPGGGSTTAGGNPTTAGGNPTTAGGGPTTAGGSSPTTGGGGGGSSPTTGGGGGGSSPTSVTRAPTTPAPTPEPIVLSGGDEPQPVASRTTPVTLEGTGTIRPPDGESQVLLEDVTVPDGSAVTAIDLVVGSKLTMSGTASLAAATGEAITIENGRTGISMSASGEDLPVLNLGQIGSDYKRVPSSLTVTVPEKLSSEKRKSFKHALVSGETLSNCADWKRKLDLVGEGREGFEAQCADVKSDQSGKTIRAGGVRTLFIVGIPDDDGPNYLLYGGIGAAVVVVIVIIVVVKVKCGKKKSDTYSGSDSGHRSSKRGHGQGHHSSRRGDGHHESYDTGPRTAASYL